MKILLQEEGCVPVGSSKLFIVKNIIVNVDDI